MKGNKPGANSITAELLVKLQQRFPQSMCWRNNTGKGLGWSAVKAVMVCLRRGDIPAALMLLTRPITFGMVGSPDVIGMVALRCHRPLSIFVGFEIKVDDKQSPEQVAFELRCKSLGGAYILARSVDDALDELEWTVNEMSERAA